MAALRLRNRAAGPGRRAPGSPASRSASWFRRRRVIAVVVVLAALAGVAAVRSSRVSAGPSVLVSGPIADKWNAYGGSDGILGDPVSAQYRTFDGMGSAQDFEGGIISYHPLIREAFAVTNDAIIDRWFRLGRENWGYPISDTHLAPFQPRGSFNHFAFRDPVDFNTTQERSIYHTAQTGAVEVLGAIRDFWGREGWEESHALFPSQPERPRAFGSPGMEQQFEGDRIVWTPSDGASWLTHFDLQKKHEFRTGSEMGLISVKVDEHGNWGFHAGAENQFDDTKQASMACVLRASSGQVFSWSVQGQLPRLGHLDFPAAGQPALTGRNLDIAAAWPSLMRGHEFRCGFGANVTQEGWIEDLTTVWGVTKEISSVVQAYV